MNIATVGMTSAMEGAPNTEEMASAIYHMDGVVEFWHRLQNSDVLILKGIAQRASSVPIILRPFAEELNQVVKWNKIA